MGLFSNNEAEILRKRNLKELEDKRVRFAEMRASRVSLVADHGVRGDRGDERDILDQAIEAFVRALGLGIDDRKPFNDLIAHQPVLA